MASAPAGLVPATAAVIDHPSDGRCKGHLTSDSRQGTFTDVAPFRGTTEVPDVEREVLSRMLSTNAALLADRLRDARSGDLSSLLTALAAGRSLGLVLDDIMRTLVDRARAEGHTWAAIGGVLGVSRQAVFQRFGSSSGAKVVDVPTEALSGADVRAVQIFEHFLAGRWEEVQTGFDRRMTEGCSVELLVSVRSNLELELGRFVEMGRASIRLHGAHTVADVPLVFERGRRKGWVTFDADARVAGFFVLLAEVA